MATTTTRLALRKPDPAPVTGDFVNAALDLNANWDKVDGALGAIACTSGARPGSPYNGQFARETDTGNLIVCTNTVGPVWKRVFIESAARWAEEIGVTMGTSTVGIFNGIVSGDSVTRFQILASGQLRWGPGSGAHDAIFYRNGVGILKTDTRLQVGGDLEPLADLKWGPGGTSRGKGLVVGMNSILAGDVASSTGAEVAVTSAQHTVESTYAFETGRIFCATLRIGVHANTGATESITSIGLRKGAQTVAGTLLDSRQVHVPPISNTFIAYVNHLYWFKNTSGSTVNTKLSITNARISGSATISLFGSTTTLIARLTVEDVGAVADHSSLATSLTSV